jgi:hypothetical protein
VRVASPVGYALGVVLLFACGSISQDELDCEEAVSVLVHCCPGFDSTALICIRASSDCGSRNTSPALSRDESKRIRGESCETLVTSGECARAQQARSCTTMSDFSGTYYPPVCQ